MAEDAARGPLGQLVDHIERQRTGSGLVLRAKSRATQDLTPDLTPDLAFFRRTWSRLSADQRLAQSASALPENAGPLNSQQLVHRALTTMREVSPAYLERFVSYVDALLWIDQATGGVAPPAAAPKSDGEKKQVRTRRS